MSCMENNQLRTKSYVELEDNFSSQVFLGREFFVK